MRRISTLLTLLAAGLGPIGLGHALAGPLSTFYVTDPVNNKIYAIQGGGLVGSTSYAYSLNPGPGIDVNKGTYESAIAVSGDIRTAAYRPAGVGGQYTLSLASTGTSYTPGPVQFPGDPTRYAPIYLQDGTTDGTHNYGIVTLFSANYAVRFERDWTNGQVMFQLPSTYDEGIAFDPFDHSLWVLDYNNGLTEYSLTGTALRSFPTASRYSCLALGFDPADRTLWFADGRGGADTTLYQYSREGALLSTANVVGLPSGAWLWGGEFNMGGVSAVPEPSTLLAGFIAIMGAALSRLSKPRL